MPQEFKLTHRVQFPETDLAGVVHFSNFFRWMEEAEHAWFRSLGLSVKMAWQGRELGWPRVSASCDFSGSARFEDEVELVMRPTRIGEKSLSYEVEFLLAGKRIALGKTTSVCCALADGEFKSIPIPDEIRHRFQNGGG